MIEVNVVQFFRNFVIIVGNKRDSHPSFIEAYNAGLVVLWVKDTDELRRLLAVGKMHDLIVFDAHNETEKQCKLCRELVASRERVICIGCTPLECGALHAGERDLLSTMVAAAGGCGTQPLVTSGPLKPK